MKIIAGSLFLLILLIAGCGKQDVIEEDKFVKIYSELLIAGDTTSAASAKKDVLGRYKVSEKSYQNTVEYYSSNPEQWDAFFTKVVTNIEQLKKKTSSKL